MDEDEEMTIPEPSNAEILEHLERSGVQNSFSNYSHTLLSYCKELSGSVLKFTGQAPTSNSGLASLRPQIANHKGTGVANPEPDDPAPISDVTSRSNNFPSDKVKCCYII
jgi:hypothetical protein